MSATGILQGKAVVITGSGQGIGRACALAVARLGAAVVVNDVNKTKAEAVAGEIRAAGAKAVAHVADIASWSEAAGLIERCVGEFGAIDGLVNNAALFMMGRLDEMTDGDTQRLFNVNVVGTVNCSMHAVKQMQKRRKGSIVNVTSGAHMGIPAMGVYGATKGAVASFTYTWAMELKDSGIRVNALSPQAATAMGDSTHEYYRAKGLPKPAQQPPAENNTPVVEYLLSDASNGVTGQIVRIDGPQLGLCAHPGILMPMQSNPHWTCESVAEAFERDFAKRQLPLGIVGMSVQTVDNPSDFWKRSEAGAGS
jgi:NAD(P)-dependent dehydrogenase (short-subunit alcohol dehydrogenase family)